MSDLDAAFARIAALAGGRGLPGLTRLESNALALAVAGTAFCHLRDARTLVLACPAEQKILLMEISPQIYFETDDDVGSAVVLVHLDAIPDEELALRLDDAWRSKAPEELVRQRPAAAS